MVARRAPLIIGHRGACGYRPEHTLSAYELALAQGVDAIELDLVVTKDGIVVVRHDNELSGTTDIEQRLEYADRRTTKHVDGQDLTGWFSEDFTWVELAELRTRERFPTLRPGSASFDGQFPILRFGELLTLLDRAAEQSPGAPPGLVVEIKHATYFEALGLPLDQLLQQELDAAGWSPNDPRLIIESFEKTVLEHLAGRAVGATRIYLVEAEGAPADLVAAHGVLAMPYSCVITPTGLRELVGTVHGISVDKSMLFADSASGYGAETNSLVADAHAAGLEIYCWTLRAENCFLEPTYRRGEDPADHGNWCEEFRAIMRTRIDGVFTDQPDLALAARSADARP
ncbi:glycerophosphodiester phosphodiesterase family protein [Rathayibacter toxicus]|uniref:glycerophosphodiester phosphodiesterase family protein n=1 Tax=Rathayibacter toxicus TaxID=145458 RepID=UPI000CE7E9C8|nr:glycerophosphodiester phosphodiesterase family protein [Rathayibacter toxicus]PPI56163.1 glycerophosphodiester phosphodiesterase [Rathayibacter toxicus]QOD10041.1 glycerophosphodiester phosphodiesterase [Rathayibacter toxicus]QWL28718.1 glycerophosphodiester phosphodiesterase [Rathayibacter toxicus]QWL30803.1 glycerophosphodiester phosphodiesterase [Rathayibacter toxicus]QWL32903.1 glycerophosphodiester phosphodiesterase [Rathayibacter toxicus]